MAPTAHALSASLISSARSVAGLRVEAWDADGLCPDLIDVAIADARGQFEMRLDSDYLASLIPRRKPSLIFLVFDGEHPVALAQRVVWQVTSQVTRLQIPLSAATPSGPQPAPAPLVVRGTIRRPDGTPVVAGIEAHAFDRTLSRTGFADTEIGTARTDADGQYEIRYTMPAGGKVKPDLIVRAQIGPAAQPTQLESPLITNAPATAHVDLGPGEGAAPRASEYRQIIERLTPILQRGGVALADLANEHADFAASSAGVVVDRVRLVRQALRLERDAAAAVPAEIFYGILRMGFQATLVELPGEPLGVQRQRLEDAIELNAALKQVPGPHFEGSIISGAGAASKSPTLWTWHHVVDRPGLLQLLLREKHAPGSIWQPLLHPGRKGGMSQWGFLC